MVEEHGLYDACILGGGDTAIACAGLGDFDSAVHALRMTRRHAEHYRAWARPFCDTVRGGVGSLDGRILHLWHDDPAHRRALERNLTLERFEFDPFADIMLEGNGVWRWNSCKPEMHQYVSNYFASRSERCPSC